MHERRGPHAFLKWIYLALYLAILSLNAVDFVSENAQDFGLVRPLERHLFPADASAFLLLAMWLAGMAWLWLSWAFVPAAYRKTRRGRVMTPATTTLLLLVPCYNLYWCFVANLGLCDALEYLLGHYGSTRKAPRAMAVTACLFQLIPLVSVLVAPFFWFLFMLFSDEAKKELAMHLDRDAINAAV